MKEKLICFLLAVILLYACGCTEHNSAQPSNAEPTVKSFSDLKPDNETDYEELITRELDIVTLKEKYLGHLESSEYYTIKEVFDDIGIECLREKENGIIYSVHKVKQGGLFYMFFLTSGVFIGEGRANAALDEYELFYSFYAANNFSYADFSTLEPGTPIEKFESLDPMVKYYREYYENSDFSDDLIGAYHYLEDGILCTVFSYVKNGELKLRDMEFIEDFKYMDARYGRGQIQDLSIFQIDRVKN